jgi:hypothetical protein
MSCVLPCLLVLVLAPAPISAQQIVFGVTGSDAQSGVAPPRDTVPATGRAAIRGRVVSTETGLPLRRATVRLNAPEIRGTRTALTDGEGRYEFRDLPAGRFSISASKAAFVNWSHGQTQPSSPGKIVALTGSQTADNIDVRLPRGAVITGRVTDEFGEPVPNAAVTPFRQQYAQGQRRLLPVGSRAEANDIGEYRIFGLAPGQYYLSVTVQALTLAMPGGNGIELSGQNSGYAPTFYPATADLGSAQKLMVGAGQTISGIDVALTPARLAAISGVAIDAQGRPMTGGNVFAAQRSAAARGMGGLGGPLRADGSFSIPNVPPGEYVLRANTPRPPAPGAVVNGPAESSVAVVSVNGGDVGRTPYAAGNGDRERPRVVRRSIRRGGPEPLECANLRAAGESGRPRVRFRHPGRPSTTAPRRLDVRTENRPRPHRTAPICACAPGVERLAAQVDPFQRRGRDRHRDRSR